MEVMTVVKPVHDDKGLGRAGLAGFEEDTTHLGRVLKEGVQ